MGVFLVAVGALGGALAPMMAGFFMANPALNGVILGVGLVGVLLSFRNALSLRPDMRWLEDFTTGDAPPSQAPRLLAPVAQAFSGRRSVGFSAISTRTLLDGISSRLDENRETARYFVGLTIFLGLLGTFWGLLSTVSAIAQVIGDLTLTSDDLSVVFADLQSGLEAPLSGMGTAFSSSLFGLSCSLVLGFLDLQAGQAQNNFYNGLEDWLSRQTRFSAPGGSLEEGSPSLPAYTQALLEKTADSLDELSHTLARSEETTISTNTQIRTLSETMVILTDQMRTEQAVLLKLAQTQADLRPLLKQLSALLDHMAAPQAPAAGSLGAGDQVATHIRNMDSALSYIANQAASGREAIIKEMRSEIRMLARTLTSPMPGQSQGQTQGLIPGQGPGPTLSAAQTPDPGPGPSAPDHSG
ncbi:flagellar motor protein MotA [Phaeovibrio sulfidiphilus]|uniref:Flagellar motor protein MotA n=2 Tax=Phaeovibrio sulfidiphilus TaxID=1220600 RepID=A0A8J6YL46_9PROT|nr:flagellar motor protein MotA [Phaeovibrio sulfidiphilus]